MWASQGWAQKVGYPDGSGPQLVDPRLLVIPGGESQVSAPQCDRAVSQCGEPQGEGPTEIGTKEWAQLQGVGLWGWARGVGAAQGGWSLDKRHGCGPQVGRHQEGWLQR